MENQDNRPVEEPVVAQETEDYAFGPETEAETETEAEGAAEAEEAAEIFSDMPSEKKAKRKKGKKKNKDKGRSAEAVQEEVIGTAKGVETMFRNAVRSEMELLALAATKANIMISLNGFIVSALMISGAFIFSSSPEFLIPASTFMITAAASIVFALLSASPDRIGKMQAARAWLKDFVCRRATLKDWKTRVSRAETRFFGGSQPNILIYEDRVKVQKERYWEMMQEIMGDRKQVYHKMSDHLYWLGLLADKQFKYINLSYAVFRWGLLASLAAFIGVKTLPSLLTSPASNTAELRALGINMFNGVYEPSAVQQLPDGKLLIAEDEPNHAFSIISIDKTGRFIEDEALDTRVITGFKRRLSDLEALARDDEGFIYALTSHSRTRKGNRSPDREHLMRFKIQDGNVLGLTSYDNLTQVLETDHKLHDLIRERTKAEVSFEEINIEGMAFDPVKKRLVLGFRDPEFNNMALVAFISNPKDVFERNAQPEFDEVAILDIDGGGIRSLNYDPVLKNYVIANEVKDENGQKFSQLWTWSGNPTDEPQKISLPNLQHITNVEAVDSITVNGKPQMILMGDEGNASQKITAKYMLVDYSQLGKD
ncbi:Pycsar system effector family protein [Neisseria sp. oral taxon 014]|uniref:Pycsar system effector family protein n=1 Tax=Neisseria sp. oral taxon 014 TaxID=641148 RepID=UPI0002DDE011|nr:Pycsar system effector family protein [Neisseria sp. oral taxon 014]